MRAALLFLGGCGAGNACACLLDHGSGAMTEAEILALPAAADACFGVEPAELEGNADCLPVTIGRDAATSLDVVATLHDGGIVFLYEEVGYEDCCRVGGVSQFDLGDDGAMTYAGCAPAPLATATTCLTPP